MFQDVSAKDHNEKVEVCHIPPGNPNNPQIISVSEKALGSHEDHGDHLVSAEVCDGIDNDCDGIIDNNPTDAGGSCSAGVGQCSSDGVIVCTEGALSCDAVPGQPQPEVCDGLDNDCDGAADDDPTDAGGECSAGVGACQSSGTEVCIFGALSCDAVPGQPQAEVCNGADDDCDGTPDNDPTDAGAACSAGAGECRSDGVVVCANAGLFCDAVPGQPQPEVCDGLDNDCNGLADEGGDSLCDDGDMCNGSEICQFGTCSQGQALNCDDGNVCTDDACDPSSGCVNTNNSAPCNDGNECTTSDICADGACFGGPPPNCDDGEICTDDVCISSLGCVNEPNTNSCDDGDACSIDDVCQFGQCTGGPPADCGDGDPCTVDACHATNGCTNHPVECGSGSVCDPSNGNCTDVDECSQSNLNNCHEQAICLNTDGGFECVCNEGYEGDGVSCSPSGDQCADGVDNDGDGNTDCFDIDCDGLTCNDGNLCTVGDTCIAGSCDSGSSVICPDTGDACIISQCNPQTGNCESVNANEGQSCDDAFFCNGNEICVSGTCVSSGDPCSQGGQCSSVCNEAVDNCFDPADSQCDDGTFCTINDVCDGTGNCVAEPLDCNDNDPCTVDQCVPDTGCNPVPVQCPDGLACNPNNGQCETEDECPNDPNKTVRGICGCNIPDDDRDNDGVADNCLDNCPQTSNEDQSDFDGDGIGDACDSCPEDPENDIDRDGICGERDNCPTVFNPEQTDSNQNGIGDACDDLSCEENCSIEAERVFRDCVDAGEDPTFCSGRAEEFRRTCIESECSGPPQPNSDAVLCQCQEATFSRCLPPTEPLCELGDESVIDFCRSLCISSGFGDVVPGGASCQPNVCTL